MRSLPQTAYGVADPPFPAGERRKGLPGRGSPWGIGAGVPRTCPRVADAPGLQGARVKPRTGLTRGGCCLSAVAELKAAAGTVPPSFGVSKGPVGLSAGGEDAESGCIVCHGRGRTGTAPLCQRSSRETR